MSSFGFKILTEDNWLQADELAALFVRVSFSDGSVSPMTPNDWISPFLHPSLVEEVPTNVRALFEVARGSLAYGYFFYPLYTLASEQLYSVAETAIVAKCKLVGAPQALLDSNDFPGKLRYLKKRGYISEQEFSVWEDIHQARNEVSHPEQQAILLPGIAAIILERTAEKINSLFA